MLIQICWKCSHLLYLWYNPLIIPKDAHILSLQICEYVTLHAKRTMQTWSYKGIEIDYPRLFRWVQFNHKSLTAEDFSSCNHVKSKLILLPAQQANTSRRQLLGWRIVTLFRKPTDWDDGKVVSQNHLTWVWMLVFYSFMEQRVGGEEVIWKRW